MQILLCAATEFEIKPVIDFIKSKNLTNTRTLITGIGLAAAAYQITKAVYLQKPQLIIQAGIAGSLDNRFPLKKVVVVKNDTIGDIGVEENGSFNSLFDLQLNGRDAFPWTNGQLCNRSEILNQLNFSTVNSVSVNEISTNKKRIEYYKNNLKASIECMEGAALHYVGLMENIPFLQIRSLSNFVGERDKDKWQIKEAISNLNLELQRLISKLTDV